jgi:hypothetical protein
MNRRKFIGSMLAVPSGVTAAVTTYQKKGALTFAKLVELKKLMEDRTCNIVYIQTIKDGYLEWTAESNPLRFET